MAHRKKYLIIKQSDTSTKLIAMFRLANATARRNTIFKFSSLNRSAHRYRSVSPRVRHLLSISDLNPDELRNLVKDAFRFKHAVKNGTLDTKTQSALQSQTIAMMFNKRSTRTRISTEGAVSRFGGHPMFLGKDDIQLGVCLADLFAIIIVAATLNIIIIVINIVILILF